MSGARRLLIVGGIALALWGMGYGLWYAVFAEHQALEGMGGALTSSFSAAAERDAAGSQSSLKHYQESKYAYDRHVDAHGHWIGLAMVLIVVGIGFDRIPFSDRLKYLLAAGLLPGAVIFPLGVLLQTVSRGTLPRAIAIAGAVLVTAALTGIMLGVARNSERMRGMGQN